MASQLLINQLNKGVWFRERDASFQDSLLQLGHVRELDSSETLFRRGDPPDGVYAVLEGSLRISGVDKDGRESILTFVEPPDWLGELALFDGNPRTHDAIAVCSTRLFHVPSSGLKSLLSNQPAYWRDFGIMLSGKLRLSFNLIEDLALLPAPKRLAKRLLMMADNLLLNDPGAKLQFSVDQMSLGSMLSISRQTTNQVLKDLQQRGFISSKYGQICILDQVALRSFVTSD